VDDYNVLATEAYMKAEIKIAQQVQELLHVCGYPSFQEAILLLQDGNVMSLQN
jgi:hypothetical protein